MTWNERMFGTLLLLSRNYSFLGTLEMWWIMKRGHCRIWVIDGTCDGFGIDGEIFEKAFDVCSVKQWDVLQLD
jgi:hypothetical protein